MPGGLFGSGGGGGQQQAASGNVNITPTKPAWYPPMNTTIQNQPGQLSSLAQDMTAGGFGSYEPDLAWLRNVFRPAQSVAYTQPEGYKAPAKKPTTKTPTTPVKKVENPGVPVQKTGTVMPLSAKDKWMWVDIPGGHNSGMGWRRASQVNAERQRRLAR